MTTQLIKSKLTTVTVSSLVTSPVIVVRGILDKVDVGMDLVKGLDVVITISHDASLAEKDDITVISSFELAIKDGKSITGINFLHVLVEPSDVDGKIQTGHDTDSVCVTGNTPGSDIETALLNPDMTTLVTGLKHDSGTVVPITIKECTELADPALHPIVGTGHVAVVGNFKNADENDSRGSNAVAEIGIAEEEVTNKIVKQRKVDGKKDTITQLLKQQIDVIIVAAIGKVDAPPVDLLAAGHVTVQIDGQSEQSGKDPDEALNVTVTKKGDLQIVEVAQKVT